MDTEEYGIIGRELDVPKHPVIRLLRVSHEGGKLVVSYPAFGKKSLSGNIERMAERYTHPETGQLIQFRQPLTQESVSACAFNFLGDYESREALLRSLQLGRIVLTPKGVFTNTYEIRMEKLDQMLASAKEVRGIFLLEEGVAFVPYESFETSKGGAYQEGRAFAEGGLARGLEYTEEAVAKNLGAISDPKFYSRGVRVYGFGPVSEPVQKIVSLRSANSGKSGDNGLHIYSLKEEETSGYVFGVPIEVLTD